MIQHLLSNYTTGDCLHWSTSLFLNGGGLADGKEREIGNSISFCLR